MRTAVVSFGCPRSGTTFLDRCLNALHDVAVLRIPDGSQLHPSKSAQGLIAVSGLLFNHHVVFVRIVRDPMAVVDSFLALRQIAPRAARARDSNARIVEWIVNERRNVPLQIPQLLVARRGWGTRSFVEVRYEDLADEEARAQFVDELVATLPDPPLNCARLLAALAQYGREPVIGGKLREGIISEVMTQRERTYFTEHLRCLQP